jgi:hypothetical protein
MHVNIEIQNARQTNKLNIKHLRISFSRGILLLMQSTSYVQLKTVLYGLWSALIF